MLIVGLTGGVASGKSTVAKVWQEEGAYVIDADQIARDLVRPHTSTWRELVKVFGNEILQKDESLDRKALAAIIFSDRTREIDSTSFSILGSKKKPGAGWYPLARATRKPWL